MMIIKIILLNVVTIIFIIIQEVYFVIFLKILKNMEIWKFILEKEKLEMFILQEL